MASLKSVSFLEQSTRENGSAVNTALNTEPLASTSTNGGPSLAFKDPLQHPIQSTSKDESQTETNGSTERLIGSSHPQYSAVGVTVPANGRDVEPEEIPAVSAINRCSAAWEWYKNTAVEFRNSCFIHIIHALFIYIPISALIVGLLYTGECPKSSFLPIYEAVIGVIGIAFMSVWIAVSCSGHCGMPCPNGWKIVAGILFTVCLITLIIEISLFGHLSPKFDLTDEDYCNKTFYYYVIGKEIVTVTALILSAILFFPESSLHTCLRNCSAPSPASAFFSRL